MKKIIRNIFLGFLIFSNSFAMENSKWTTILGPKKVEEIAITEVKETKYFYFDFLRIEQLITQKKDVKLKELFFDFISRKLDSMIDQEIKFDASRDDDFIDHFMLDSCTWIKSINGKSNVSLSNNLVALIYLRKIQIERRSINRFNFNTYFFISYIMAQNFLEDLTYRLERLHNICSGFVDKDRIVSLEIEFLELLHFNLSVQEEEFKALCNELVEFIKRNTVLSKKN